MPLDAATSGLIIDDTLSLMLQQYLRPGATLRCLFDCCHSGSALDLDNIKFTKHGADGTAHFSGDDCTPSVMLLSACTDAQTSADTPHGQVVPMVRKKMLRWLCRWDPKEKHTRSAESPDFVSGI